MLGRGANSRAILAPLLTAATLLVLLAGCVSTRTVVTADETWQQRRTRLQGLDQFAFKGRLAAAVKNDGFNASLQWQQQGGQSDIDLRAPLGFGSVHIVRDGERFALQTSRGEKLDGDAALASLATRLGFAPPLDALRYWILGVPAPQRPAVETPSIDARYLTALEQDGWRVQYEEYRPLAGSGVPMPRRAQLTRADARLRLIVDEWTL
ncbi:MAG: lipoprotein insertase outer membrane protein LolB [Steroidobacteraceae bacterium]